MDTFQSSAERTHGCQSQSSRFNASVPVQQWMVAIPTLDEVRQVRLAVSLLSSGKVPGADGIHPKIIQHGGQKLLEALTPEDHHNNMGYKDSPTRLEGCPINNPLQKG